MCVTGVHTCALPILDKQTNQTDRQTDRQIMQIDKQTRQTDRQADRQIMQIDKQTRQTDRQAGRQAGREGGRQTHILILWGKLWPCCLVHGHQHSNHVLAIHDGAGHDAASLVLCQVIHKRAEMGALEDRAHIHTHSNESMWAQTLKDTHTHMHVCTHDHVTHWRGWLTHKHSIFEQRYPDKHPLC